MPAVALYRVCRATLGRRDAESAWLVVAWWLAYTVVELVVAGAAIALVGPTVLRAIDAATRTGRSIQVLDLTSSMHALAPWTLVASLMRIPAAALAIVLITRIDRAQELTGPPVPPRPDLGF
jgi:hypothetical protein